MDHKKSQYLLYQILIDFLIPLWVVYCLLRFPSFSSFLLSSSSFYCSFSSFYYSLPDPNLFSNTSITSLLPLKVLAVFLFLHFLLYSLFYFILLLFSSFSLILMFVFVLLLLIVCSFFFRIITTSNRLNFDFFLTSLNMVMSLLM